MNERTSARALSIASSAIVMLACSGKLSDQPERAGAAPPFASPNPSSPSGNSSDGATGLNFGEVDSAPAAMSGYFDGETCAGFSAGAEEAPAVLQLLVDTSGSMNESPDGNGSFRSRLMGMGMGPTKWTATRTAVLDAVAAIPADTSLGVVFFPNVPNDAMPCYDPQTAVGIDALGAAGSRQRQSIQDAFGAKSPDGGTPTHDAYRYALSGLAATQAIGRRFLVLITDGAVTYSLGCMGSGRGTVDTAPLIAEMASALSSGIRTFVIGSPGSEDARESLSRMAEAGGTALDSCSHAGPNYCHFDMTQENDLAAGLEESLNIIAGVALSCNYSIPDAPGGALLDPGKVNVLFAPPTGPEELIGQSADSSCREGWQYAENQTQIRLCPNTCERVRGVNGALTLQFGCTTRVR